MKQWRTTRHVSQQNISIFFVKDHHFVEIELYMCAPDLVLVFQEIVVEADEVLPWLTKNSDVVDAVGVSHYGAI